MQKKLIVDKTNFLAFKNMLKNINLDEKNIIIVPDKFSLNAEKLFFEEKNVLATFSTQVFSITKLASRVLEEKLKDTKLIDKNISLMIISSIINENLQSFKYFKNIKNLNHITEDIFNVISQLLSSNIEEFNENLEGNLKDKFEDLKLILYLYKQKKEEILIDASKKYELFLGEIKNSSFIKDKNIYFGMFNSMTSQVKEIVKEISKYARSVCFSTSFSENRVNNNEIYEFYKSLKPETQIKKTNKNKICNFIEKNFFTNSNDKLEIGEKIKLFEANNFNDEIENLVLEIKKEIFLNGRRFKDITVCVSNVERYKDILIEKFEENNFNFFIDSDIKLIDNSYAKFVLSFINLLNNFNASKILSFIKSGFIDLDITTQNNFERFLFKYSLINQENISDFACFKDDELYDFYLKVYKNIIKKIEKFKKSLKNFDIYQFFNSLLSLLEEFGSKAKLKEKTENFKTCNILKYKQFSQVEDKITEVVNNICEYYKEEISISKIENFMKICFQNTTISVPATSVDSIFVGDLQNSYFSSCKCLFVLGADSTNFPKIKQDVSLFTDSELEKLEKDSKIEPKLKDANRLSYYKAFNSLMGFEEKIILSYSLTDEKGAKQFPSSIYKNFINRFLSFGESLKPLKTNSEILDEFSENEILNLLSFKFNGKTDYLRRYFCLENSKEKNVLFDILTNYYKINENKLKFDFDCENIDNFDKIDKNLVKIDKFSSSSLENYFTCPNKFLFKELFKIKELEPVKLDAKNLGNIVHSCSFILGKEILKREKANSNTKNENSKKADKLNLEILNSSEKIIDFENKNLNKIDYDKIINYVLNLPEYKKLQSLERSKEILNNLREEIKKLFVFIENQQKNSEFLLKKVEFGFDYEEDGIKFKGRVDRIDESEKEFIVIDYKTGNTKIEYKDIVFCKKIQLILYAKILEKVLNKKCKGIYYLSVNDDFTTKEKMKIYLNGITENTENAIFRLDNLSNLDNKTIKSNYFEFQEKFLLNGEQFGNLLNKTYEKVIDCIKTIKKGEFSASPLVLDNFNSCDICEYKEICKNKKERKEFFTEEMLDELLNSKEI